MERRNYPVGIQTFSDLRARGCIYIDKTELMWEMQQQKYVFLSRPRRFGKSLLSSTLHSFFAGERELFEGLKVMELEKDWIQYPVLHLDLSLAKNIEGVDALRKKLLLIEDEYVAKYGGNTKETTPGAILNGLIRRAYEQTGRQVVVIIDEYDAPLLDALHEDEELKDRRRVMQEFFAPLKACDPYIRFCFITGITKFSQLSIFSTLNNLLNISMLPRYSALCGITERELTTTLWPDIVLLAEAYGCTPEEMHALLKNKYAGYRFAGRGEDVYNPYSLMKAFLTQELKDYWFESGTPTFLFHQMQRFHTDLLSLEDIWLDSTSFDRPTEALTDALPLLYQSGYLTIKDYERDGDQYMLSLPNQEVRAGFADGLLPTYVGLESRGVRSGFALKFWRALKQGDIDQAMQVMQGFMAGLPYVDGFKQKLAEAAEREAFYEYTLYLIFTMLNVYVRTQVRCASGRVDMIVWMPATAYVFELKVSGTAEEALAQIDSKDYALRFAGTNLKVVKIGVKFNPDTRVPEHWVVA